MDDETRQLFVNLEADDKLVQYDAFQALLKIMDKQVDWAYDVWDKVLQGTTSKDPHYRSRAAQFLSYLAISDPKKRILKDFPAIWAVTYDEKFVPKRHTIQAIWRIGLGGDEQKRFITKKLYERYKSCENEKNVTLIRNDILTGLYKLYIKTTDEKIKKQSLKLVEMEKDPTYKKKYMSIWDS